MGFASLFEDAVERLTEDLRRLRQAVGGRGVDPELQELLSSVTHAESLLRELVRHEELVTDPDISPAERITVLEGEVVKLAKNHAAVATRAERLNQERIDLMHQLAETKVQLRDSKKRGRELKEKIDKLRRQRR